MKKILLIFSLVILPIITFAQFYKIDSDNMVVSRTVENIKDSKEEIYKRAENYLTHTDIDITSRDNENWTIIGKGLYSNLSSYYTTWMLKASFTLRIDVKDGRARIICSAQYVIPTNSDYDGNDYQYLVTEHYPLTKKRAKGVTKKAQKKAFDELVIRMNKTVHLLSEVLKSGGTLDAEKEDW